MMCFMGSLALLGTGTASGSAIRCSRSNREFHVLRYPDAVQVPQQGQGPHEAHHAGVPADGAGEGRARLRRPRRGLRADMPNKAHERWLEILKAFVHVTNFAEIGAGRCMSMLMEAVPNNELRNGYHVQFVDEMRHTGMQMSLARWYAKHAPDGAGWHIGPKAFPHSPLTMPGLQHALPLHRRRPDPVRVHAPGRRRDRVHQHRLRGAARRRGAQRRLRRCRRPTCRSSPTRRATSPTATRRCSRSSRTTTTPR